MEGIIPALESAHASRHLQTQFPEKRQCSSNNGRGDKDMSTYMKYLSLPKMKRFESLFKSRKDLLSIYFTADIPHLMIPWSSSRHCRKQDDFVEIGIPFQILLWPGNPGSGNQALKTDEPKLLFRQLKDMRKEITMPVTLMGYILC